MDKDKAIKLVEKFLDNKYTFRTNFTQTDIDNKDIDLESYTDITVRNFVVNARPYPGVILYQYIADKNIKIESTSQDKIDFRIQVRLISRNDTETMDNDVKATEYISVAYQNKELLITDTHQETTTINTPFQTASIGDEEVYEPNNRLYQLLIQNSIKLKLGYYRYRTTPKSNPLDFTTSYPIDIFGLLYWLLKNIGINMESTPLTSKDIIDSNYFTEFLKKGHTYKSDIDRMEIGDIIFFDMNDNLIGIYIGDSKFMTIVGKFPMDKESTLDVYNLEDSKWWVRFNGRVLRLKEDVYDE